MGRRTRWRCLCHLCTGDVRRKLNDRFEEKLAAEAFIPDDEPIFESWFDWDKQYDT